MQSDHSLKRLADVPDFQFTQPQRDVRGWHVITADDRDCGTVHDLIVDTAATQVRYLDVTLDVKTLKSSAGRHVLIPIQDAQFDERGGHVRLREMTETGVAALPPFEGGAPLDAAPATAPRANDAKRPDHTWKGPDDIEERRPTLSEEEPISGDGTHKHARWGGPLP